MTLKLVTKLSLPRVSNGYRISDERSRDETNIFLYVPYAPELYEYDTDKPTDTLKTTRSSGVLYKPWKFATLGHSSVLYIGRNTAGPGPPVYLHSTNFEFIAQMASYLGQEDYIPWGMCSKDQSTVIMWEYSPTKPSRLVEVRLIDGELCRRKLCYLDKPILMDKGLMTLHHDNHYVTVVDDSRSLWKVNVATGTCNKYDVPSYKGDWINCLCAHPNGSLFIGDVVGGVFCLRKGSTEILLEKRGSPVFGMLIKGGKMICTFKNGIEVYTIQC